MSRIVLVIGSAPNAVDAAAWDRRLFTDIVAINNAWRVRPDWDHLIFPDDFPRDRWPTEPLPHQAVVRASAYVPIQNQFGGFVYAGGTMAYTAGYWALGALKPRVMAFFGCDMVYSTNAQTHFYGKGAPDPLREDISLRSLEAKSARLLLLAAQRGCACVNLSQNPSRLVFPRATLDDVAEAKPVAGFDASQALQEEARLSYYVPSGKYWKEEERFDPAAIDALDALWLSAYEQARE
ncbi:MAG: hypothetical protein AAGG54_13950 [Pseudomonadota bacterium]